MPIYLDSLFNEFCQHFDGQITWSAREQLARQFTDSIFEFFSIQNQKEITPYIVQKEYMRIDYIWRFPVPIFSTNDIELAVEHENVMERIDALLDEEIQHLIDLKARNKVAICYVAQGDEEDFIDAVGRRIRMQSMRSSSERYLIILGNATTREKKRAILFKGFFFDSNGKLTDQKQKVILQAS